VTGFHFQLGRSGFRQKAALIIFPEEMQHLPTAATIASGPSALSEGRVPHLFLQPPSPVSSPQGEDITEQDFRLWEDHPANPVA
jgi:hypothetical protein